MTTNDGATAPPPIPLGRIVSGTAPSKVVARTPTKVVTDVTVDITDKTRRNLAYALLLVLGLVIAFLFYQSHTFDGRCPIVYNSAKLARIDLTKDLCESRLAAYNSVALQTQNVFTALIGLVGSVVGFYFGQKSGHPA